jgi:choice-of-anchor A domain-containing protein
VSASTLGHGFSLGDAGNYAIIAFSPSTFNASSKSPIVGSVGLGASCGVGTVQLNNDKITGNLVSTGNAPSNPGGTVTGTIIANNTTLASDISTLKSLSATLANETGTTERITSGTTIAATSGVLDSMGDYVFTITQWANNLTISGTGSNNVVLNFAGGVTPNIDNVTLIGGITANQVLFNDQNTTTITATSGDTFNGTLLAANAIIDVTGGTVNGQLYGGASGQTFSYVSGATLTAPANTISTTTISTVSASDSTEVQVLGNNSSITTNGTAPTGSLCSLYGTADKLEFIYNASNTVSVGTAGIGTETGMNSASTAFLEITNSNNPFASNAQVYVEGEMQSGEKFYADATLNQLTNTPIAAPNNTFDTSAGANIFAYVFTSQSAFQSDATPLQTMTYNASGTQAMHLGDQIGSMTLVGYVGTNGGHLVS